MTGRATRIEQILADNLDLAHLEVLDESGNHSVPDGAQSHFKVVAVSDQFDGRSRIDRHRAVNGLMAEEFAGGMHALAIHTYTPREWRDRFGEAPMSPPCASQTDTATRPGR